MIYFLSAPSVNLAKIGFSVEPEGRIKSLRLLSPVPLEIIGMIPGDFEQERALHARFLHLRSHGEWFHATAELRDFVSVETLSFLWAEASAEARQEFLERIDTPVFDRSAA
jgi:hypothetical protein